jgi:hypothetical protein
VASGAELSDASSALVVLALPCCVSEESAAGSSSFAAVAGLAVAAAAGISLPFSSIGVEEVAFSSSEEGVAD